MTGTSVDAIDIAELFINKEECKLLNAQSFQFPEKMRNKILEISRKKAVHDNFQISSLSDELAYIYAESIDALRGDTSTRQRIMGGHTTLQSAFLAKSKPLFKANFILKGTYDDDIVELAPHAGNA